LKGKFPLPPQPLIVDGFSHTLIRQYYGYEGSQALGWKGFCGGSRPYSHWMYRDELIQCLNFFGFTDIKINFDNPNHPGGPAFALIAGRAV
jgi:hypothetical protein